MKIKILLVFVLCFSFLSFIPVSAITSSEADDSVSLITSSDAVYSVSALSSLNLYDDLMAPNSYTDILFNYYLSHTQLPLNDFFIARTNQYEYMLCSFNQNMTYAYIYTLNYTSGYDSSIIINDQIVLFSELNQYIFFDKYFLSSTIFTNSDLEIRPSAYIELMRKDNIYLCYLFILILFIFYVFRCKYNPYKKVLS